MSEEKFLETQYVVKAVQELTNSTPSFSVPDDYVSASDIVWHEDVDITEKQINDRVTELKAEHDAQEYARKRQAEFPSIQDLVVALYDTDDKADIEAKRAAVKAKYPKPE